MHKKPYLRWMVTSVCIGSLLLPPGIQTAAEPTNPITIRDVALGPDGSLRGSLMTAEGKPHANADVMLRKGNEVVGVTKTQVDGSFNIRQVRPGVYELAASRSANLYRVWTARTAPPSAQSAALIVQGNTIVRGQEEWSPVRRAVILGGVIITSGVIGGVIGYNVKDDAS